MSGLLRHLLSVNLTDLTTASNLDLTPTVDQEMVDMVKNGFFLTCVVLLFLYVLKLIYVSIILFKVMMATSEDQTRTYPGTCSLICDIISCIGMIVAIGFGLYAIHRQSDITLMFGVGFMAALSGAFFNNLITLITICNTENHTEYTLSYGLISMAIVITESLSVNVGGFHTYYQFLAWKKNNPGVDLWPLT